MPSSPLSHPAEHELFDADHDLDLVILANNARTPADLRQVEQMGRARFRARRDALKSAPANRVRRSLALHSRRSAR